jgi:hypothetical protein
VQDSGGNWQGAWELTGTPYITVPSGFTVLKAQSLTTNEQRHPIIHPKPKVVRPPRPTVKHGGKIPDRVPAGTHILTSKP